MTHTIYNIGSFTGPTSVFVEFIPLSEYSLSVSFGETLADTVFTFQHEMELIEIKGDELLGIEQILNYTDNDKIFSVIINAIIHMSKEHLLYIDKYKFKIELGIYWALGVKVKA